MGSSRQRADAALHVRALGAFDETGADRLALPLSALLTLGGDTRVEVDPVTGLSPYGCSPVPRPDVTALASSTASSISVAGYAAAEIARQELTALSGEIGFARAAEMLAGRMKAEVGSLFQVSDRRAEVVLSPSGTDSQLHSYVLAGLVFRRPVVSILAASDETGRGVSRAVCGQHFNSLSPQGLRVTPGAPLEGLHCSPRCVEIPCRDEEGNVVSPTAFDAAVASAVSAVVARNATALLHVMDHSKLGTRCPSSECVDAVRARWGDSVQVVIDACQARLSRERINAYLAQGFLVVLTGSKFFAGPAFSGVLLVPPRMAARLAQIERAPVGLQLYAWRGHWPAQWCGIRAGLSGEVNIGAHLRWAAAIEEIRGYFRVPAGFRITALRRFAEVVPRLIQSRPALQLLPERRDPFVNDGEMAVRTIFSFLVRRGGTFATAAECRDMHERLNRDLTVSLDAAATPKQRRLAAHPCHLGQPVEVRTAPSGAAAGALRVSVDARFVYESFSPDGEAASARNLAARFERVERALDKLALIAGEAI
jgi:hypothetical protein